MSLRSSCWWPSRAAAAGTPLATRRRQRRRRPYRQPVSRSRVSGIGNIAVHPSAVAGFGAAIEFPIRIQETAGGSAIWNYFRVSYFRGGVEIERSEQGATSIRNAWFRDIGPRSSTEVSVITRVNATDFDDVRITLGFIDKRDSRSFEQNLSLAAFNDVVINPTPALLPGGSSFAIVETPG